MSCLPVRADPKLKGSDEAHRKPLIRCYIPCNCGASHCLSLFSAGSALSPTTWHTDEKESQQHLQLGGWSRGLEAPNMAGPRPSPPPGWGRGRGTLFSVSLAPKQKIWPHMLGWEGAGVSLETSGSHSKQVSRHPPRSFGGDGSLEAARSPSCCLGIGYSSHSCSSAW